MGYGLFQSLHVGKGFFGGFNNKCGILAARVVEMAVGIGSPEHKMLHAVFRSRESLRIRTDDHLGMWLISKSQMPPVIGGLAADEVRYTLLFAGEEVS